MHPTDAFELSDLVVEVLHDSGTPEQPAWKVGSGFLIGSNIVLTAAHNVSASGELLVRFRGLDEYRAKVSSLPSGQLAINPESDIAVLEITSPEILPRPYLQFARINDKPTIETPNIEGCWAIGFPRFQEKVRPGRNKRLRESARVDGFIPMGEGLVEGLLTLSVTRAPRDIDNLSQSQWQGMSGALVFSDQHAVGLVTEHNIPAGSNSLTISPFSLLDGCEDAADWWRLLGVKNPNSLLVLPSATQPISDKRENRLFERLLDLDFEPQVGQFKVVIAKNRIASFLIHGPLEYGQSMLTYRLNKLVEVHGSDQQKVIKVDARANDNGKSAVSLWEGTAKAMGLDEKTIFDLSESNKLVDMISQNVICWWDTQDVIFIFKGVDYLDKKIIKSWLKDYWKVIVRAARKAQHKTQKPTYLLLFLVDFKGKVESEISLIELDKSAEMINANLPVRLKPNTKLHIKDINKWIPSVDVLPLDLNTSELLNIKNRIPEKFYREVYKHCGFIWKGNIPI